MIGTGLAKEISAIGHGIIFSITVVFPVTADNLYLFKCQNTKYWWWLNTYAGNNYVIW